MSDWRNGSGVRNMLESRAGLGVSRGVAMDGYVWKRVQLSVWSVGETRRRSSRNTNASGSSGGAFGGLSVVDE